MKKFFTFLCVCLAFIPALVFAGCGKKETAKDVRGHKYIVSSALRGEESMDEVITNKLRITFTDDLFIVEYGIEGDNAYGAYLGSYTTNKNTITLTKSAQNDAFATSIPAYMDYKMLEFKNGKLIFEDIVKIGGTSKIYNFQFTKAE